LASYLDSELDRLRGPSLVGPDQVLSREDFFDMILLIKLKTTQKLTKDVGKNQRERVRMLEEALTHTSEELLEAYFQKTMDIFENEFDLYEVEF